MKVSGFEIVDDRPVPEAAYRKYPFSEMDVGQCALIETESIEHENAIRVAASQRNKRTDKRFIVRQIPDKENCVGVWRVE